MKIDKRKYPRHNTSVAVRIWGEQVERHQRHYLDGIAANCDLGGLFIATEHLLSKGSIVTLEFTLTDEKQDNIIIKATAVVRWIQRWTKPRGIGVEFVEFEGVSSKDFNNWLSRLQATE